MVWHLQSQSEAEVKGCVQPPRTAATHGQWRLLVSIAAVIMIARLQQLLFFSASPQVHAWGSCPCPSYTTHLTYQTVFVKLLDTVYFALIPQTLQKLIILSTNT